MVSLRPYYAVVAAAFKDRVEADGGTVESMSCLKADLKVLNPIKPVPSAFDTDAQAFITAAAITDSTQQSAIDTLVVDLKDAGIWTKMKAIYPIVGGTASSHKFNLKDPRDLDAAFRLTFSSGWTHSSSGILPSNAFADTKLIPSSNFTATNFHFGGYTSTTGVSVGYHGCYPPNYFMNSFYSYNYVEFFAGVNTPISASGGVVGLASFDKNGTNATIYDNGTILTAGTKTSSLPSVSFYLGAANNNGTGTYYDDKELSFYYFSDSLTSGEVGDLYTAVQAFQTTLGRQV